ncbi:MAG TPA: hypothetical protein VMD30_04160 [Tepidisphaeraceae bacterium]|nr:hypothetical protein [Tepidisphaeraceae bacterium]
MKHTFRTIAVASSIAFVPMLGCSQHAPPPAPEAVAPQPAPALVTAKIPDQFDESRVRHYTLPDALVLNDGQPVTDAQTWYDKRRPEILQMFEALYYGKKPPRPADERFVMLEETHDALGGKAIRKQVAIQFRGFTINMLIYLPAAAPKPVPVFLCLSFSPLQNVTTDPNVILMDEWVTNKKTHVAVRQPGSSATRGTSLKPWQTDEILSRGYGIAWIYYDQIEPDWSGGMKEGVRGLYLKPGQSQPAPDEWGAIGAWSWGASRALDYLQIDPDVDGTRVVIMGQSRLGKTAVWTGASDPRFAVVFACNSGRGGASLARRNYGETTADLARNYGYQFCGNFQKYAGDPTMFPMDTHELLGLIAPRPVFLTTGSLNPVGKHGDRHSDPHGEFLAAVAAGPMFQLLGGQDLGIDTDPPLDVPAFGTIAYCQHTEGHLVTPGDWTDALAFADWQFKGIRPTIRLANMP